MAALFSKSLGFLIDPTLQWLILFFIGLVLRVLKKKRIAWTVLAVTFVYMTTILLTPVPKKLMMSLEADYLPVHNPEPLPAVVILSGGTALYDNEAGQYLWMGSVDRILQPLIQIVNEDTTVIMTGRQWRLDKNKEVRSETLALPKIINDFNISTGEVILETQARSTLENAERVADILREKGIERFYLVTSAYHMKRSMRVFKQVGLTPTAFAVDHISVGISSTPNYIFGKDNVLIFKTAVHEYVGMAYYKVLGWFRF